MTSSLKVAFIGTGAISDLHYAAMNRTRGIDVVGLYNENPRSPSLLRRAEAWGLRSYQSFQELVQDSSIDAVVIVSPTACHAEQALAAAKHGKHVLIEKPVALEVGEIEALLGAEEKYGVRLMPAHNFVYRPVVRKAKELLQSGALGTISYVSLRTTHFLSSSFAAGWRGSHAQAGGGAMIDSGMHLVYQLLYLCGVPHLLSAFTARRHLNIEDEDVCQIALQYADGTLGYLFQSWAANGDGSNEIRIHGDKQSLCIQEGLFMGDRELEQDASYQNSFYHLAQAFHAAVCDGIPPLSTLHDAKIALQIVQTAYAAAQSRRVMDLSSLAKAVALR